MLSGQGLTGALGRDMWIQTFWRENCRHRQSGEKLVDTDILATGERHVAKVTMGRDMKIQTFWRENCRHRQSREELVDTDILASGERHVAKVTMGRDM